MKYIFFHYESRQAIIRDREYVEFALTEENLIVLDNKGMVDIGVGLWMAANHISGNL